MKNLALATLLLGATSVLAGCPADDPTAQFDVEWILTSDLGDLYCTAAGVDTIKVTSRGAAAGDFVDLFDCIDGFNATALLPLDDYTVWIDALDAGNNLVAQSNSQLATLDLDGELVPLDFDFPVDGGFFALTWTLVDDATNDPLTCGDVAAGSVEVISTPVGGGGTGLSDIFDCVDLEGVTAKLPLDTYTVVVEVLEEGTELSLGTSNPREETLDFGNELIDLGNFEFAFL
jgi:hypothetical protein